MKNRLLLSIILSLILAISFSGVAADDKNSDTILIFKFDIKQEIYPAVWRNTQKSLQRAKDLNVDYVIIHMNTYGGLLVAADSIRTAILNYPIPVFVFIDNNAASAGALIAMSCDSIYMRKGANIGAATVVNQNGEVMPDKIQSYMRSMMRATAESHGQDTIINGKDTILVWKRNPHIAEAMVDATVEIEGVTKEGKVLTFTTSEAIANGFCEGEAENIAQLLKHSGIANYRVIEFKPTSLDAFIGFLMNPVVQGILIMIIIGGIYFELQTPGLGFPSIAAVSAAILYFAPLYLEGLAEHWEIILFILGLLLLGIEIFAIPGFGIAGLSGIGLIIIGLTLSLIDNVIFKWKGSYSSPVMYSLFLVCTSVFGSIILSIFLTKKLFTSNNRALSFLVLKSSQFKDEGYIGVETQQFTLLNKTGKAVTILRPSGKVEIEGEMYDANALSGYIDRGEAIQVVKYETGQVYVKKIEVIMPNNF